MKAIRVHQFGGPAVLKLEEVPTPRPGPGQILVRVSASGVNPVETYIRSGAYAKLPALPYTPGTDCAGLVEALGDGVESYAVGGSVYTSGTVTGAYAEFAICTVDQVHALPADVTFAQGAALGVPYATAYRALMQRAQAQPGETVLIHGASGGVGAAATQIARAAGLQVLGTAGTEEGLRMVAAQGAHAVFNHRSPDYLEQVRQHTGGKGVDVVLEMLANVNLGKDLTILGPRGRVVVIGSRGPVEINPRDAMGRDADIRGMVLFNATPAELAGIHAALVAGLENGSLQPVIAAEYPLAEAAAAHESVMAHEGGARGKIVLVP
jgi:NADPH2:quinone reductase